MSDERPLSRLQLDILELEAASWREEGSKITEFRRRHPSVTATGYTVALLRLLDNQLAYEYAGGRYVQVLTRIRRLHAEREAERGAVRGVEPQ